MAEAKRPRLPPPPAGALLVKKHTLMAGENELRSRKKSKDKDGSNQNEPAGTGAAGEKGEFRPALT